MPTWTISKDFGWSASHVLAGLPAGHQCGRLHGHNYVARVTLEADSIDTTGFVLDYGLLKPFGAWIDDHLDHRHLNDVPAVAGVNPTAEHLAEILLDVLEQRVLLPPGARARVAVSETPKTWAEFRR